MKPTVEFIYMIYLNNMLLTHMIPLALRTASGTEKKGVYIYNLSFRKTQRNAPEETEKVWT